MKKLFVCELCGKIFEDEHEARRCERSHFIPLNVTPKFYDEGKVIPELVTVSFGVHEEIYRRVKSDNS
jgi:hypothetical protein|nr:MAG TPA: hypothetical protein [Caudoviricetes sp.]